MKEIEENNQLIAEFMGGKIKTVWWGGEPVEQFCMEDRFHDSQGDCRKFLRYHESWDELMPVVEKIEARGFGCKMYLNGCQFPVIKDSDILWPVAEKTKIEAVWQAVVIFIKWHNNHPTK